SHPESRRRGGLGRSPRRDHKYRTTLADRDDHPDGLIVLLPRDSHDPAVRPFPRLKVASANDPVAFATAQPSERMRLFYDNSRFWSHVTHPYATLPNENTRPS